MEFWGEASRLGIGPGWQVLGAMGVDPHLEMIYVTFPERYTMVESIEGTFGVMIF